MNKRWLVGGIAALLLLGVFASVQVVSWQRKHYSIADTVSFRGHDVVVLSVGRLFRSKHETAIWLEGSTPVVADGSGYSCGGVPLEFPDDASIAFVASPDSVVFASLDQSFFDQKLGSFSYGFLGIPIAEADVIGISLENVESLGVFHDGWKQFMENSGR